MLKIFKSPTAKRLSRLLIVWIWCLLILPAAVASAAEAGENLQTGFDQLLGLVDNGTTFSVEAVAPILEFMAAEKDPDTVHDFGVRDGARSAYNEFDLGKDLKTIIRYAYNPKIPTHVFRPTTVRLTRWLEVDGEKQPLPDLWKKYPFSSTPLIVRGTEYEESTPEVATGACYGYDLRRALAAFSYEGKNVFVSVSKQNGKSRKGTKGICLGGEDSWDFIYTAEVGLTKGGLSWAETHIYDAASVSIYYEVDRDKPLVRCGVFKWIEAGWAGLNFVKSKHIHKGIERFAQGLSTTIQHPRLPEPERLIGLFEWIEGLPRERMAVKVNSYLQDLRTRYAQEEVLSTKSFEALLAEGNYAGRLTQEQMESVLTLECMKWILGRATVLEKDFLSAPDPLGKRLSRRGLPLKHLN